MFDSIAAPTKELYQGRHDLKKPAPRFDGIISTVKARWNRKLLRPSVWAIIAGSLLLGLYFAALSLISGWTFAKAQFFSFRYYIVSLAAGFGVQIGLYVYLKDLVMGRFGAGKVIGVTGSTSSFAMISCCTHYLANLLPVLGATGAATFVTQYQVQFFWVGLLFNLAGISYMVSKVVKASK